MLEELVEVVKPTPKPKSKKSRNLFSKKNASSASDANDTATDGGDTATPEGDPGAVPDVDDEPAAVPTTDASSDAGGKSDAVSPVKTMKKVVHRLPLKIVADYSDLAVRPMSTRQVAKALRTCVAEQLEPRVMSNTHIHTLLLTHSLIHLRALTPE